MSEISILWPAAGFADTELRCFDGTGSLKWIEGRCIPFSARRPSPALSIYQAALSVQPLRVSRASNRLGCGFLVSSRATVSMSAWIFTFSPMCSQ